VYSIRAEARRSGGAMFVREAVVQMIQQEKTPVWILAWGQGSVTKMHPAIQQIARK
jgi:hypothetical protein